MSEQIDECECPSHWDNSYCAACERLGCSKEQEIKLK